MKTDAAWQLALLIESMAEHPKGTARAAYLHAARLIRDKLCIESDEALINEAWEKHRAAQPIPGGRWPSDLAGFAALLEQEAQQHLTAKSDIDRRAGAGSDQMEAFQHGCDAETLQRWAVRMRDASIPSQSGEAKR